MREYLSGGGANNIQPSLLVGEIDYRVPPTRRLLMLSIVLGDQAVAVDAPHSHSSAFSRFPETGIKNYAFLNVTGCSD